MEIEECQELERRAGQIVRQIIDHEKAARELRQQWAEIERRLAHAGWTVGCATVKEAARNLRGDSEPPEVR